MMGYGDTKLAVGTRISPINGTKRLVQVISHQNVRLQESSARLRGWAPGR